MNPSEGSDQENKLLVSSPPPASSPAKAAKPPVNPLLILGYQSFNALSIFVASGMMIIVVPHEVVRDTRGVKSGLVIAALVSGGAAMQVIGLFCSPLSDRCTSRLGRRRPFLILGGSLLALGSALMLAAIWTASLAFLAPGYLAMTAGLTVGLGAVQALTPDLLPPSQYGISAGFQSATMALGGGAIFGLYGLGASAVVGVIVSLAIVFVLTIVTCLCARERQWVPPPEQKDKGSCSSARAIGKYFASFVFNPARHPDFFLVLVTKVFVMATLAGLGYQQLFLVDVLRAENPQKVTAHINLIIFGGSVIGSPILGIITDKLGAGSRKWFLVLGCLSGAICSAVWVFANKISTLYISAAIGGIGMSGKFSMHFALLYSVMPSSSNPARYVSLSMLMIVISQVVGGQLFGLILEHYATHHPKYLYTHEGYQVLFSVIAGFEVVATCFALFIDPVRGHKAQKLREAQIDSVQ